MSAQTPHGFMAVKEGRWTDGAKILYHGRTYRPAGAKDLCGTCWEARDHFERARRMRIRSFLIANLGVFEVSIGATQFEDVRALGVFHALVGGALMSWGRTRGQGATRGPRWRRGLQPLPVPASFRIGFTTVRSKNMYLHCKLGQMKRLLFLTLMTLSPWLSAQIVVAPLETCAGDPVNLDASGLASAGVSGVNGSALQFGSGDYMRIPITAALSDFQEVTIEFWYYQISRGEEFIVATEYFNTGWGFHNENPNVMQWRVEGGPYSLGGATYPIPYNQWVHVAGVYDGSELRLYVDGNLIASEAFSGPISDSRNEDIVVNRHVWASGSSSRLTGYLDELRISGVARYSDNFTPPAFDFSSDDQTLGLWHFDSSTGLMLDDSDYGHHGTSSGTGSTSAVPYASYDTFDEPSYLWSNGMTSPTIDVAPQAQETFVVTVTQGDQVVMDSVVLSPDLTCCPGPGCCLDGTVWDFDLGGCVMEEPPFVETGGAYASVNPCYFDSNDDGLVEVNDLMNLLSVYNLTCSELH